MNPGNYDYANTGLQINNAMVGNYDNFATYANLGNGATLFRIKKTGTSIALSYTKPGDVETTMGTVSSTDDPTSYNGKVYQFLSSVASKRVALFAAPGFDRDSNNNLYYPGENVAFSRFYTDQPLVNQLAFADELDSSKFSGAWSFNVNGNNPVNTEDPANYNLLNSLFNVTVQRNNLGNTLNAPSVTVGTGQGQRRLVGGGQHPPNLQHVGNLPDCHARHLRRRQQLL